MKKKIPLFWRRWCSPPRLCSALVRRESLPKATTLSALSSNYTSATDTALSFLNISRESEYWDYRVSIPALSASRKCLASHSRRIPCPLAGGYQYHYD